MDAQKIDDLVRESKTGHGKEYIPNKKDAGTPSAHRGVELPDYFFNVERFITRSDNSYYCTDQD